MFSEVVKNIQSGLNRKLASIVLFSILLIEFIVLIPSVISYQKTQVRVAESHAELLIETLESLLVKQGTITDPQQFSEHLQHHEMVKGFSICGKAGCIIRSGEAVSPTHEASGEVGAVITKGIPSIEVTRHLAGSNDKLWIVLKIESAVDAMVVAYTWKTLGIIALISIFVTLASLISIVLVVINPVLKLKQTMYLAMEDPTQPTKYILENNNQDEIADLTQTYNRLLFDISHYQDQLNESKREVERGLSASEARWKFALEGSGDGVWDWNPLTDSVFFSSQFLDKLGYQESTFIDQMWLFGNSRGWHKM
ncbi:MAG: hypothetical protein ACPG47_08155 [Leucothrix sp.]